MDRDAWRGGVARACSSTCTSADPIPHRGRTAAQSPAARPPFPPQEKTAAARRRVARRCAPRRHR
eukprot:4868699-Pleurochrysis_carterae.AAC.1